LGFSFAIRQFDWTAQLAWKDSRKDCVSLKAVGKLGKKNDGTTPETKSPHLSVCNSFDF